MARFTLQPKPPPAQWGDFESLCRDLWAAIWDDPNTQKNGRQGQPQAGVDVFGRPGRKDTWAGLQCKLKDQLSGGRLKRREIRAEVEKAGKFVPQPPGLSEYAIATTALRDAAAQEAARQVTAEQLEKGSFPVTVYSWEEIWALLEMHPEVMAKYYPEVDTTPLTAARSESDLSGEKVFVSSTWLDNQERRKWVEEAIIDAEMVPVGMERFTASTQPTVEGCIRLVEEADVLVGVVARRYGWIPPGEDRSITEIEYDAAAERLMFVLDPQLPVQLDTDLDEGEDRWEKQAKLEAFKGRFSADQMPAYFREDSLSRKVLRALQEWRKNRVAQLSKKAPEPPPPPDADAEIRNYLKRAESLYETLPLAGFPTTLRVPIRLEDLLVELRAMPHLTGRGEAAYADAADAEQKLKRDPAAEEIPATEAFSVANRRAQRGLVLLGDPGSGKTTQLKRLLLWVLRKGPEGLGLPRGMVPVFLPLRELEDLESGLDAFLQVQLDHPHLRTPGGFGERLLDRGNLLFLLDGLDEVADPDERWRVAEWINQAAAANSDCRFVVSSRFAGYGVEAPAEDGDENRVRLSEHFLELHLRPLTREQSEAFVLNWYRIVERAHLSDAEQAEEVARSSAKRLIERLREPDFRARRVSELTRNPLLLTNLCLVHRDRGQLPRRRADLYGECVDVLLESWRAARGLPAPVTAKDGRRVLQPAAYWLHSEEGRTRATAEELAPVIEPSLQAIRWQGGRAEAFLGRIRDESGLLTGWDQKHYGFMHLGFQEYLAAREIRRLAFQEPKVLRELASHHGESWWQEVALLLVALEEPSLFVPYLTAVLDQPAAAEAPEALAALLEDAAEVSEAPFLALAARAPGTDRSLWARQLLALRVLEAMGSAELEGLKGDLLDHPSQNVRSWLGEQKAAAELKLGVSERGDVELVRVPAGSFLMGSPEDEEGRYGDESPQHKVNLPSFEIGRYAVTNEEYGRFLAAHPDAPEPEYWSDRKYNQARQPVVGVSWEEARRFAAWAGCQLASEAEWEYAARAGTTAPYLEGASDGHLERFAWYGKNSAGRLHPVGEKEPNEWGLYDVLGNVWEWVEDDWHGNYGGAPVDGSAWIEEPRGERRVLRGGSFNDVPRLLRVACRYDNHPGYPDHVGGFRVVRSGSGGQE